MECLIHCADSEEKLTKVNSLPSWETLGNAAPIRKFEPIFKILEETEPDILQDIWYHHKCRSSFTIKNICSVLQRKNKQIPKGLVLN